MLYLGIDLHRKQLIVSLRNEKGDVLLRRQVRQYMELVIEIDGTVRCLYDEAIDLARLGKLSIRRGSHVEPAPDGQWLVDLSPVGGPLLAPFARRSQALAAERQWLAQHWL